MRQIIQHTTTYRVLAEHWISFSTSGGHFIFSSSMSSVALSSAGGVGDSEGDGDWSSDGTFSFFFSNPLAFDSIAGMAGGSSDCTGLAGSERRPLLT